MPQPPVHHIQIPSPQFELTVQFHRIYLTNFIKIVRIRVQTKTGRWPGILTRETDYALRLLRGLSDGNWHTAGALAEQEMVPQAFAYKILKKLSKGGFAEVVRGADGGWRLTADLERSSLYDLMIAMEERCTINACMEPAFTCQWRERNGPCSVCQRLCIIQKNLEKELRAHSLASFFASEP